jgi:hypothetical protein
MAKASTRAMLREHIGSIGHTLHAACNNNVRRSGDNCFGRHHCCLHAGTANLVDCGRADRHRQSGTQCCLPGRGLTKRAGQDAAHDYLIDSIRSYACALDSGLDCRGAQLGRGNGGEDSLHAAHRRASIGCDNNGICSHDSCPAIVRIVQRALPLRQMCSAPFQPSPTQKTCHAAFSYARLFCKENRAYGRLGPDAMEWMIDLDQGIGV